MLKEVNFSSCGIFHTRVHSRVMLLKKQGKKEEKKKGGEIRGERRGTVKSLSNGKSKKKIIFGSNKEKCVGLERWIWG